MRNRGDGSFERIETVQFQAGLVYTYVVDLTGDGLEDVLIIDEHGASAWEFGQNGINKRGDILNIKDKSLLHAVATFGDFAGTGYNDIILGRSFKLIEGLPPNTPPPVEDPADDLHLRFDGSTYNDISAATGISKPAVNTLSLMSLDMNNDGRLDLIVGTQHDEPDRYLALTEDGTFADVGEELGITSDALPSRVPTSAMGFDAADIDGDGDFDLFVTDDNPTHGSRMYTQREDGTFTYSTDTAGLQDTRNLVSWGNALADFNHDGHIDLFIANGRRFLPEQVTSPDQENALFLGNGDGTFTRALSTPGSGLEDVRQSFGSIFGDIDGDGDLDALVLNANSRPTLLRNDMGGGGHWLSVHLKHPSLMPVVGAVVTVTTSSQVQRRWLHGTPSFGGSSQPELHFGLADASEVLAVEVQWPGGKTTTHGPFSADQIIVLQRNNP
jgi:hypothetical protein